VVYVNISKKEKAVKTCMSC